MTADANDASPVPAEIQWLHDSVSINYQVILDIRNESAVAALALHEWPLYIYNNKVYTQLFKELSADNTLADYCRVMQESQSNKRIAMILLIVILLLIVPAYYMVYYRHRLYDRRRRERIKLDNIEFADDELRRMELEDNKLHVANNVLDNCLSALKHETMYYPSRIRQLVDKGDVGSLDEVTQYYRELYGLLSTQAVRQVEQVKLHVSHTTLWETPVLGNENLLRYLADILRPQHVDAHVKDDRYVVFTVTRSEPLSDIDYLRCRQIIRDHGDATHRRACGITVTPQEITITLPTYEDVPLELKGTEGIVRNEIPEAEVIGTADDELSFWRLIKKQQPDLVLLDLGLGGSTTVGVEICRQTKEMYPQVKVLIFTGEILNEKLWVDVLDAGADGIILKSGELLTRHDVRSVMEGKALVFNEPILERIVDRFKQAVSSQLASQEALIDYEIDEYDERFLRHLALGYTKEQITTLRGMPFGVKSLEKRQNELVKKLFPGGESVNATRLVVRAIELRILDIDNLVPDAD